jgi:DNA-binding transcriptional LysR family regulator
MDNIGALNAFVQAAEARSFTKAGQALGVSSSAVGKAVARLEARLAVRLFHRSTRSVTLTPEGALFLERCRRIFCEIEAAELELAQLQGAPRGKLRISLPHASVLLVPALAEFMRRWPQIELDLDFSDRFVDVIDEGFDGVIRAGDVSDSRLMSRKLGTFHLKLVAAPGYLAAHGTPARPAELASHACLLHRYATSGKLEPWPLRRRVELPTTVVANSVEPLICMAEQGLGIACLPDFAIRGQLAAGTLVTVLDRHVRHTGVFRLLWPSSRHLSPKLRVFIDFMAEHLFAAPAPAPGPDRSRPVP